MSCDCYCSVALLRVAVGWSAVCDCDALAVCLPTGVYLLDFFCSGIQFCSPLSPNLCFISLLYLDLYVLRDDALIS